MKQNKSQDVKNTFEKYVSITKTNCQYVWNQKMSTIYNFQEVCLLVQRLDSGQVGWEEHTVRDQPCVVAGDGGEGTSFQTLQYVNFTTIIEADFEEYKRCDVCPSDTCYMLSLCMLLNLHG